MHHYERITVKSRRRAVLFRVTGESERSIKGVVVTKYLEDVARIARPFGAHVESKMRDRDTGRTYYATLTVVPKCEVLSRVRMVEDRKYGELVQDVGQYDDEARQ